MAPEEQPVGALLHAAGVAARASRSSTCCSSSTATATRRRGPQRAKRGDPVALWGPRTRTTRPADTDWLLLAADETGLPAVAVILEQLPAGMPALGRRRGGRRARAPGAARARRRRGDVAAPRRRRGRHDDAAGRCRARAALAGRDALRLGRRRVAHDDRHPPPRPRRARPRAGRGLARRLLAPRLLPRPSSARAARQPPGVVENGSHAGGAVARWSTRRATKRSRSMELSPSAVTSRGTRLPTGVAVHAASPRSSSCRRAANGRGRGAAAAGGSAAGPTTRSAARRRSGDRARSRRPGAASRCGRPSGAARAPSRRRSGGHRRRARRRPRRRSPGRAPGPP